MSAIHEALARRIVEEAWEERRRSSHVQGLRYSCDLSAQALAYKLGDVEILAMRKRRRAVRGALFDLRDFHADRLANGALPLPDVRWSMDQARGSSPAAANT